MDLSLHGLKEHPKASVGVYRWLAGNLRLWTVQELVSRFARASQKHTGRSRNNLGMDSFVHTLSSRKSSAPKIVQLSM